MTRMPAGQPVNVSSPVNPATNAPTRTSPLALTAGPAMVQWAMVIVMGRRPAGQGSS